MRTLPLVVIDVETGGLDPQRDALLSVAAVDSRDGARFHTLVRAAPGARISDEALAVNGFCREDCLSLARPAEADALRRLAAWLDARRPFIAAGCNVAFDAAFLRAAAARAGLALEIGHRLFDIQTLALAAHALGAVTLPERDGRPSASLDAILKAVGLARPAGAHRADEDAALTARAIEQLFAALRA